MKGFLRRHKWDVLLIAAVLTVSTVLLSVSLLTRQAGAFAVVVQNGKEISRYPLSQDTEVLLGNENGNFNRLVIADGVAFISEASCPDRLCVKQRSIRYTGQRIVCLPNRLIVSIEGGDVSDVDLTVK